uniref:Uncharacterized protein n=1 Tax=Trichogramma kaykai TaxID=54128 RepID=A0ABD2WB42_9HYME
MPDFPILFINNQPVLKLFMFNIPKKQNKKELIELLKPTGADGFVIKDFDKRGKFTRAHVYCRTLAVSLKFQTASILGLIETGFFSTKQKSYMPCKAKIRPDREFTSTFEEVLTGLQARRLEIVGNSHLRGKFLAAIDVDCIKLKRCINLSFQAMADALRRKQRLKVLFMHGCIAFDFLKHLDTVIDAIFSENSTLFAMAWTFSKPQNYPDLAQDFVVLFNLSSSIKFLDISNASFFKPRLHDLLGSIPNVVDLTMINISINQKCNLADLKSLRRLTITWASDIENVLVSLPLESLQTLRLTGYWECPLSELDFLLPIINAGVEVILMNFTMPKMDNLEDATRHVNGCPVSCPLGSLLQGVQVLLAPSFPEDSVYALDELAMLQRIKVYFFLFVWCRGRNRRQCSTENAVAGSQYVQVLWIVRHRR